MKHTTRHGRPGRVLSGRHLVRARRVIRPHRAVMVPNRPLSVRVASTVALTGIRVASTVALGAVLADLIAGNCAQSAANERAIAPAHCVSCDSADTSSDCCAGDRICRCGDGDRRKHRRDGE